MRQSKKRGKQKQEIKKEKRVIRCKARSRPVYEYEVCSQFNMKVSSNNQKNCVNCSHSF